MMFHTHGRANPYPFPQVAAALQAISCTLRSALHRASQNPELGLLQHTTEPSHCLHDDMATVCQSHEAALSQQCNTGFTLPRRLRFLLSDSAPPPPPAAATSLSPVPSSCPAQECHCLLQVANEQFLLARPIQSQTMPSHYAHLLHSNQQQLAS